MGKDIIPAFLEEGKNYMLISLKAIGKMSELLILWEADMDLLNKNDELDLKSCRNWKIYTEDVATVPPFIGPDGKAIAFINQGCKSTGKSITLCSLPM